MIPRDEVVRLHNFPINPDLGVCTCPVCGAALAASLARENPARSQPSIHLEDTPCTASK